VANLDKLIVLNLIEVPKAIDRISSPESRKQAFEALKNEIRTAVEEGRNELNKMQKQLDEAEENHQAALDAVQKQELELIKLRQKDAPSAELSAASGVLEPLKEAMHRFAGQKKDLQTKVAPFRGVVEGLSDKLIILSGYNITAETRTEPPKTAETPRAEQRTEARTESPRQTGETPKDSKSSAPKADAKSADNKAAPRRPVYPAGSYNPFKMVDYIIGKIEAEELIAGVNEQDLKAYLAQRELEQMEEEADIAKRLNELKKKLG
jgi:hypothetical protein